MLDFLGNLIYMLYSLIGSYGCVMLIMGIVVGLLAIPRDFEKLKTYKIKRRVLPQIKRIEEETEDEGARAIEISKVYKDNGYSFVKEAVSTVIMSVLSTVIFLTVFSPYEHIGIPEDYTEQFFVYKNIFGKSFNAILPIITTIFSVFAGRIGQPLNQLNRKDITTGLITSFIIYYAFSCIATPLYAIYFFGSSIGNVISGILLCQPRRKAYKETLEYERQEQEKTSKKTTEEEA